MPRILVILAHPQLEQSRVAAALAGAAQAVAPASAPTTTLATAATQATHITVRDLYALYPDYLVDVAAEQTALAGVDLLVWLHPVHWYGMPPLMKLWLDEVFAFGWAYGPGGRTLAGADLWLVTSTGGPESAYHPSGHNRYFFDAFLPPYEQTAMLAGLRFLPPLVLHGAHKVTDADIALHAQLFAERLTHYPDWPELDDLDSAVVCDVPADARPAD